MDNFNLVPRPSAVSSQLKAPQCFNQHVSSMDYLVMSLEKKNQCSYITIADTAASFTSAQNFYGVLCLSVWGFF